jgi:hypothetical protein
MNSIIPETTEEPGLDTDKVGCTAPSRRRGRSKIAAIP